MGASRSHSYTGHLAGDTLTAILTRDFKLTAISGSGGTIQADTSGIDIPAVAAARSYAKDGRSP